MLKLSDLQSMLPTGSITFTSTDATISIKNLCGETVVPTATSTLVAELVFKLLLAVSDAQSAYNALNPSTGYLNSFPQPLFAAGARDPVTKTISQQVSFSTVLQLPVGTGTVTEITN